MITIKVKKLKNAKDKMVGLLFKKQAFPVLMETRFGIHTFGLTFPIDIVILDSKNVVWQIKYLKPFRIFIWNPKYNKVLELPENYIKDHNIKIGDKIKLVS